MNILTEIRSLLKKNVTLTEKETKRFFKTNLGDYAEQEKFIGVRVPDIRKIAAKYKNLGLNLIQELLGSIFNEERLLALIILNHQYHKKENNEHHKEAIFNFYLKNLKQINNWNLVDSSAHLIIGAHLIDRDRSLLLQLLENSEPNSDIQKDLWKKRIAIVATLYFIRKKDFADTLKISKILINDERDLIQKATGWMLREVGEKNEQVLLEFLDTNYKIMPRTMLRYAIEKLDIEKRKIYMNKN